MVFTPDWILSDILSEEVGEETFTPDLSEDNNELDLEENEEEEVDRDVDLTIDKSYDVSALSPSESDDSEISDEAHTSVTNISDQSGDPHQISVDLDLGSDIGSEEEEGEEEEDSVYKTERFCHYEEQKKRRESNKRCTTLSDTLHASSWRMPREKNLPADLVSFESFSLSLV